MQAQKGLPRDCPLLSKPFLCNLLRLTQPTLGGDNTRMSQNGTKPRGPRRWLQFSLRTLLVLTALAAGAMLAWRAYVEPYRRQRQTLALVEQLGARCQTEIAPGWLRRILGGDLQNIVLLDLSDCDEPDRYIEPVAALPDVHTLVVGGPAFGDEHLRRLRGLTSLRWLILDTTSVTEERVSEIRRALPQAEVFVSDRRAIDALYKVGHLTIRPRRADVPLIKSEWLNVVTEFSSGWDIGEAQLAHLKRLKQLKLLDFHRTPLSDAGLAHVEGLSGLRVLNLSCTNVSDAGLKYVEGLKQLQELYLVGTQVSDAGMGHLKALQQLKELDVGSTRLTSDGLAHLNVLGQLRVLALWGTLVDDAGLAHLKGLTRLERLDLSITQISDAGLAHLKGMVQLRQLGLRTTNVTRGGVADLRKALPRCEVRSDFDDAGDNLDEKRLSALVLVAGAYVAPSRTVNHFGQTFCLRPPVSCALLRRSVKGAALTRFFVVCYTPYPVTDTEPLQKRGSLTH
jgi:hypothetical protein